MNYRKPKYILLFTLFCAMVSSCDIHQFPDPSPKEIQFVLHLDYSTELPLHKIVEYTEDTKSAGAGHDIRYIINVYDAQDTAGKTVLHSFTLTKDDVSKLDHSTVLSIPEGSYRFVVWTDYVVQGSEEDHHYQTDRFEYITLPEGDHRGSTDVRDAFTGSVTSDVSEKVQEARVSMSRPLAKFNFISTDLQEFIARSLEESKNKSSSPVELDDLIAVFIYNGYMPSAYNLHTEKPTDARPNVYFRSKIVQLNEHEAEMGFDYLFINGDETTASIALEVYDSEENLLSRFKPVDVPLVRSKLTTIKANFLTSEADGGVAVNPDYDGNHTIVVP